MTLELLIGMIASGKSTYSRSRAKEGALIISHDDLTQMLHGEYRYEPELKSAYLFAMREIARQGLCCRRDVIIDRTHLTRESRAFWVETANLFDVPIIAVTFPIESPGEHANRRFQSDSRGRSYDEWLHVANHHAAQAESEPFEWASEGFATERRMPRGAV